MDFRNKWTVYGLLNGLERLQDFSGVGVTLSFRIRTPIVRAHSLPLEVSNLASHSFTQTQVSGTNSSARDLLLENYVRTLWTISLPEEQGVSLCSGLEVVRKKNLQHVFVQIYFYWARWYSYEFTIKIPYNIPNYYNLSFSNLHTTWILWFIV